MSSIKAIFGDTTKELKGYSFKLAIAIIIIYFLTGIYTVKQNEIGMVKRFGKIVASNVKPGISYALPWPIDQVQKVKIKKMHTLIIEDFIENPSAGTEAANYMNTTGLKNYLISGDNSIVNVKVILNYLILNPINYQNKFSNPEEMIQSIANNVMIKYISKESIDNILIKKRSEMKINLKRLVQAELNRLNLGVEISFLELSKVSPPSFILHFFNDVINANIDKSKIIQEAKGYRTNILTKARIKSQEFISKAKIEARKILDEASAEEKRYVALYAEYKKSPEKFYKTKYSEFISKAYQYLDKTLVTPKGGNKIRYTITE